MIYRLKNFLESLERFLQNIYYTLISFIKIIVISRFNVKLPQAEKTECVILGNGPSLRSTLAKQHFLNGKEIFCVNMFPLAQEYEGLRPGNLLWLDNQFFIYNNWHAMEKARPDIAKVILQLIEKTKWPLYLYLPVLARNRSYIQDIELKNTNIKILYFNYTVIQGFSFIERLLFKYNLGMPACENVLAAAVFLALNRSFKQIYLAGADHSWMKEIHVNDNNELMLGYKHFYSSPAGETRKLSDKINMVVFCTSQMKTFKSYFTVRKYADYRNIKVYNISEESYVDAFDRLKVS